MRVASAFAPTCACAGLRASVVTVLCLLAAGKEAHTRLEDILAFVQVSVHEAAGFMPMPVSPELITATRDGVHNKLVSASAQLQASCHADHTDCKQTRSILDMLVWMTNREMFEAADGTRIQQMSLSEVQCLLGLRYWLHLPGPTWCFTLADKDKSGGITLGELESTLGSGLKRISNSSKAELEVRLFRLMDSDGSGRVTRQELAAHLRAALRLRELVPVIDAEPRTLPLEDAVRELQHILKPSSNVQRRMPHWMPALAVAGAAFICWLLHRLCQCMAEQRSSKV